MDAFVEQIERLQPAFKKIGSNKYLGAIRDGFLSLEPIIIFSSIFMLVAYIPEIWGWSWPAAYLDSFNKAYNYSMGILALFATANVSKALTKSLNLKLPKIKRIPEAGVMFTTQVSFLLIVVDPENTKKGLAFLADYMGSKGLIAAFLVAFVVPNIYYWCYKNNFTIKLPDVVPQNIAEAFTNILPFSFSMTLFWLFDIVFRGLTGTNLAAWIIQVLSPIFTAADGYTGLAIIYGLMAFFWFVGIQGPSIVEPAVVAIYLTNVDANLHLFEAGKQATHVLTYGLQQGVATIGGTGATLVVAYMFAFMAKSKQMQAIGRASFIPVTFGVNEPILFGAPLILNPTFFIPFVGAPIINVWLFKFFVDVLHMRSFLYNLPWTTPGPLYIYLGTGLSLMALFFAVLILVVDFAIYYPFFKAYDIVTLKEEAEQVKDAQTNGLTVVDGGAEQSVGVQEGPDSTSLAAGDIDLSQTKDKQALNVLVLCAGGGTSGILAKTLNKLAKQEGLPLEAAATAYGNHSALLEGMDVVVLAPQMDTMKDVLQQEADQDDVLMLSTTGKQYIHMTRNAPEALRFITRKLKERKDN